MSSSIHISRPFLPPGTNWKTSSKNETSGQTCLYAGAPFGNPYQRSCVRAQPSLYVPIGTVSGEPSEWIFHSCSIPNTPSCANSPAVSISNRLEAINWPSLLIVTVTIGRIHHWFKESQLAGKMLGFSHWGKSLRFLQQ